MTFKFTAIAPKLNINGTNGFDMRDEYAKAYKAIELAMDALADATLNGRDFQTMDDGAKCSRPLVTSAALPWIISGKPTCTLEKCWSKSATNCEAL